MEICDELEGRSSSTDVPVSPLHFRVFAAILQRPVWKAKAWAMNPLFLQLYVSSDEVLWLYHLWLTN